MDASKIIGDDGIFATRLRELMKNAKATQQDVAAAVGTTRQAISQYADGSVQPNIEKLYKIAEYFNVSADYLLGMTDVMSSNADNQKINHILGLSEFSIQRLRYEMEHIYEFTQTQSACEALNVARAKGIWRHPLAWTINKLIEDNRKNLRYERIIDLLGEILEFDFKNSNCCFALIKTWADDRGQQVFEDPNQSFPHDYLDENERFALLLMRLQQSINDYKSSIEK